MTDTSEASFDSEIPPAIACAKCGLTDCEGCDEEPPQAMTVSTRIAWEQADRPHRQRLWDTTRATALDADFTFRTLAQEALAPGPHNRLDGRTVQVAFNYAFVAEFWAVLSWTVPWALGFSAAFPRLTWHMISSPNVLLLGLVILLVLVLGVVLVHMWWGLAVEWGVSRTGNRASYATGLRFGLYACGWDLLTSPAGLVTHLVRDGWRRGFTIFRAGTQVPRTAVNGYLGEGRRLSEADRRSALWTAIWVTTVGLLLLAGGFLAAIVLWMVREL